MATGLIRKIYHHVARAATRVFVAHRANEAHRAAQEHHAYREAVRAHKSATQGYKAAVRAHQQTARLHSKSVKARVSGVKSAARQVTKGNRTQRAQQLRSIRANPSQRAQLRNRVKYKTKMPTP